MSDLNKKLFELENLLLEFRMKQLQEQKKEDKVLSIKDKTKEERPQRLSFFCINLEKFDHYNIKQRERL